MNRIGFGGILPIGSLVVPFGGFPCTNLSLNVNHKKELLRSLWVQYNPTHGLRGRGPGS